ncbi:MAG: hypothetical protein EA353_03815 [Puniceicoccaceae bacterium]|nr:MAG: hypothetical protein EA353_03815 [Puniceicoccaceae bacterium]
MQTTIEVNSKAALEQLARLVSQVDGPARAGLMQVLGRGLGNDLKSHFIRRNQRPNARNWKKSDFWREVAQSTNLQSATQDNATVAISDPRIGPHLYGATIRPRNAKLLAIPASEKAKGNEPRGGAIPGLFFVRNKKGTRFLARKGAGKQLEVHYWLKPSVRIRKDPDTLPSQAELDRKTVDRANRWIERALRES